MLAMPQILRISIGHIAWEHFQAQRSLYRYDRCQCYAWISLPLPFAPASGHCHESTRFP